MTGFTARQTEFVVEPIGHCAIDDPKDEPAIEQLMHSFVAAKRLNEADDDDDDENGDTVVTNSKLLTMRVPPVASECVTFTPKVATSSTKSAAGGDNSCKLAFLVSHIVFFVRGKQLTDVEQCFAFTVLRSKSDSKSSISSTPDRLSPVSETSSVNSSPAHSSKTGSDSSKRAFVVHVFRCSYMDDIEPIFTAFSCAFQRKNSLCASLPAVARPPPPQNGNATNPLYAVNFVVSVDIREERRSDDNKSDSVASPVTATNSSSSSDQATNNKSVVSYESVPFQKAVFKLRASTPKKVVIVISKSRPADPHSSLPPFDVERCFGVLVSPGPRVESDGMQFLENIQLVKMQNRQSPATTDDKIMITGLWSSPQSGVNGFNGSPTPACLSRETSPDVPFTNFAIAVDLVLRDIVEPVRFVVQSRARVYPPQERFWTFAAKKSLLERSFTLSLRLRRPSAATASETASNVSAEATSVYEIASITEATADAERRRMAAASQRDSTSNADSSAVSSYLSSKRSITSHLASLVSNSSVISSIGDSLRQSAATAYYATTTAATASSGPASMAFTGTNGNMRSHPQHTTSSALVGDSTSAPETAANSDSDDDEEPVLSGFGQISKDCSSSELELWSQVLRDWAPDGSGGSSGGSGTSTRSASVSNSINGSASGDSIPTVASVPSIQSFQQPRCPPQMRVLIAYGIPEALRGELWQRMTVGGVQMADLVDAYRLLVGKPSPDEKVILRDIHRTYPAHDFFKDSDSKGQEVLYRIARAFSIFDPEVGYCQGQSFLIAALALQMPEEQAFAVLVAIMHGLQLREIFLHNFELLQMRLFQLDCLIHDQLPELYRHMTDVGLETHMFASQWFLTVFSAKFPLFLVFRVIDVFLLLGMEALFKVALAILHVISSDLLALDFEGMMKYFRVSLPKRYRSEMNAKSLMMTAVNRVQIKGKRMRRYEAAWRQKLEADRIKRDPLFIAQSENRRLRTDNQRLDAENDALAAQLVTSRVEMQRQIDALEEAREHADNRRAADVARLSELEDNLRLVQTENAQLKAIVMKQSAVVDAATATGRAMASASPATNDSSVSTTPHPATESSDGGDDDGKIVI